VNSVVFVMVVDGQLCGYVRCLDVDGFGVYVRDLLMDRSHQGGHYGRMLLDHVCQHYGDETVYVMSNNGSYDDKLGYTSEGTIFVVRSGGGR